ncbi:hypothetical protein, partial [Frankia tisae]|uniref:hypothetical protein n=1 Tax=Frankia tisae TaxID=2950104 RepID=UPI0021BE90A6
GGGGLVRSLIQLCVLMIQFSVVLTWWSLLFMVWTVQYLVVVPIAAAVNGLQHVHPVIPSNLTRPWLA